MHVIYICDVRHGRSLLALRVQHLAVMHGLRCHGERFDVTELS
jgi:hypothetical protein